MCDFESDNICGFVQDNLDDFDWLRTNASTQSSDTGPEKDHTLGTSSGNLDNKQTKQTILKMFKIYAHELNLKSNSSFVLTPLVSKSNIPVALIIVCFLVSFD